MLQAIVFALLSIVALAAPTGDEFLTMQNVTMKTGSYSGYLDVTVNKSLHYVFVQSERDPVNDPIVIWFNGGPGCSSLLAFFQENGPWVIDDGETWIKENPFPWNKNVSMLYLESPAGVGYSIANDTADYTQNDMSQSQDAFVALMDWYNKFPEYLQNDLYISGESYGGVYVPYLSWQIYQNNLQAKFDTELINVPLAGFMVGNGATDWDFDVSPVFPEVLYQFDMIPKTLWDSYNALGCIEYFNDFRPANGSDPAECDKMFQQMSDFTDGLNWYDLYRHVYADSGLKNNRVGKTMVEGQEKTYNKGYTMREMTPWAKHVVASSSADDVRNDFLSDFVNNETLRTELHIPAFAPGWEQCSSKIDYHLQNEASKWIYKVLKGTGIRMLFYSGDTDGAVPLAGTRKWIKSLGWPVVDEWRPWYTNDQVSGYIVGYDGLDFATVKGVGHMAPQWARQPMQELITNWIEGVPV